MHLDPEKYVEHCYNELKTYLDDIESNKIKVNIWFKLAIERYFNDIDGDKYEYKVKKVDLVFKFFSLFNSSDGEQFKLHPYQMFILSNLFGFYKTGTDERKYKYAFLFIGRKNGKTTFSAILNLYMLMLDGQSFPRSMLVASNKTQAGIALEEAAMLIENSPEINKYIKSKGPSDSRNAIIWKDGRSGWMKVFASDAQKLDGHNPSSAILDEVHTYKDYSLFNIIKSGLGARKNPLIFLISTAGFVEKSLCEDLVFLGKKVLDPTDEYEDDSFFFLLFMIDKDDNPNDSSVWYKANPALGSIINEDYLLSEYKQARALPSEWPSFLTKHLNVFQSASGEWIPDQFVGKRFKDLDWDSYNGYDCYIGMDLSSTTDLTAVAAVFKVDNKYKAKVQYFMGNKQENMVRKGGLDLSKWIEEGYIIKSETQSLDYKIVFDYIMKLKQEYRIKNIFYDPLNTPLLNAELEKEGLELTAFRQTAMQFNAPIKELERSIYDESIDIETNPVLQWNIRNIVLWRDTNNNYKFMKNKDKDSIDGAVALAEAMSGWVGNNSEKDIDKATELWKIMNGAFQKD